MIRIGNRKNGDVGYYVGRPSVLGNPYKPTHPGSTLERYRAHLEHSYEHDAEVRFELDTLAHAASVVDITLVCWCAPGPCHAEVIRDFLLEKYDL